MKVLIGALGVNEYKEVTYKLPLNVKTQYFIYAIARNVRPDRVLILVTEDAKKKHWDALTKEFSSAEEFPQPETVSIPLGSEQSEAQEIFNQIASAVPQDAELIVDITTSLRSIPILLLSAVRYLQYARNITIKNIYYGAFEAKIDDQVPVYEMDSFVSLLDWASAVDTFKRTGSAILLAECLKQHQSDLAFSHSQELIQTLRKLSRSLDLTLSQTIVVSAHELTTILSEISPQNTQDSLRTKPILDLFSVILQEFKPFAVKNPREDVPTFLKATFALIGWYLERERYTNALQLAREWCITWCMFRDHLRQSDLWKYQSRQKFAKELKSHADVESFWEELRALRNRITHTESEEGDFDIDDLAQLDTTIDNVKCVIQKVLALSSAVEALCSSAADSPRPA